MASPPHDVIIVGAGIVGLASAYHLLKGDPETRLLLVERLNTVGKGNTARSAAAYRDMFATPLNRQLSGASISFYEELQRIGISLELMQVGYLWLLTRDQEAKFRPALEAMARGGVAFDLLDPPELGRRLPQLAVGDIARGLLGLRCGILNPNRLATFYAKEIAALGGRFECGAPVTGFIPDRQGAIRGVRLGAREFPAENVIVATGAWMGATLALAGLAAPLQVQKRQLFVIMAQEGPRSLLLKARGFNAHNLLPFTILPGGAYLRPAANAFIIGYADPDRLPGLEDPPAAEPEFYDRRIRPQLERYFPLFQGVSPSYAWAGHYDTHLPDYTPFVERMGGAIIAGGTSGSGIMKADALGRAVAGLLKGEDRVQLADGSYLQVAALGLQGRDRAPEGMII